MLTPVKIHDAVTPVVLSEVGSELPRLAMEAFIDRLVAAVYEAQA